jgi:hypothetical protein
MDASVQRGFFFCLWEGIFRYLKLRSESCMRARISYMRVPEGFMRAREDLCAFGRIYARPEEFMLALRDLCSP